MCADKWTILLLIIISETLSEVGQSSRNNVYILIIILYNKLLPCFVLILNDFE